MFDDLDKFPTYDQLYQTNVAFRTYTDLAKSGGPIDLDVLWNAAGRVPTKSPRVWIHRNRMACPGQFEEVGRGRTRRILGDLDVAWSYLISLDVQVQAASYAVLVRKIQADPAEHMLACPGGIMAVFAKGALMDRGIDGEAADQFLVDEAVERTRGQDEYAREKVVADVQRAVVAVKVVSRPEGCDDD